MEVFQVTTQDLPIIVGLNSFNGSLNKYKYNFNYVNEQELSKWTEDFKKGLIPKFYQSEPIPEIKEENGVLKIVGKSFESLVLGSSQNIFLFLYDPIDQNDHVYNN